MLGRIMDDTFVSLGGAMIEANLAYRNNALGLALRGCKPRTKVASLKMAVNPGSVGPMLSTIVSLGLLCQVSEITEGAPLPLEPLAAENRWLAGVYQQPLPPYGFIILVRVRVFRESELSNKKSFILKYSASEPNGEV